MDSPTRELITSKKLQDSSLKHKTSKSSRPRARPETIMKEDKVPTLSDQGTAYLFNTTTEKFHLWHKVIKLRYWEDLGNSEDFTVEWKDIQDSKGTIIEYSVKVSQALNGENNDSTCLFRLKLYISKAKIKIQGSMMDHWVKVDFPRLLDVINSIQSSDDEGITSIYSSKFDCLVQFSDDQESCSTPTISKLDPHYELLTAANEPLPVSDPESDSDSEVRNPTVISHVERNKKNGKTNKLKSPLPQSPHRTVLRALEDSIVKLEAKVGSILLEKKEQNNTSLCNTSVQQLIDTRMADIQVQLKSSLTSKIKEISDIVDDSKTRLGSVEKENKSLQGKVASLSERNASLQKCIDTSKSSSSSKIKEILDIVDDSKTRLASIEKENKRLQGKLASLSERNSALQKCIDNKSDDLAKYQSQLEECEDNYKSQSTELENLKSQLDVVQQIQYQPQENNVNRSPSLADPDTAADHDQFLSGAPSQLQTPSLSTNPSKINSTRKLDVVILMDSNRKFIDKKRLPTRRGRENISIVPCGTAEQAIDIADDPPFSDPKVILINTGVNDIEKCSPQVVHNNILKAATKLSNTFTNCHIVISGIIRQDQLMEQCLEVNHLLKQSTSDTPIDFLPIDHLNDPELFYDRKHFRRGKGVANLAMHLKNGIMKGLGYIPNRPVRQNNSNTNPGNNGRRSYANVTQSIGTEQPAASHIQSQQMHHMNLDPPASTMLHPPPWKVPSMPFMQPTQTVQPPVHPRMNSPAAANPLLLYNNWLMNCVARQHMHMPPPTPPGIPTY